MVILFCLSLFHIYFLLLLIRRIKLHIYTRHLRFCVANSLHCVKTWRHRRNRKYIAYGHTDKQTRLHTRWSHIPLPRVKSVLEKVSEKRFFILSKIVLKVSWRYKTLSCIFKINIHYHEDKRPILHTTVIYIYIYCCYVTYKNLRTFSVSGFNWTEMYFLKILTVQFTQCADSEFHSMAVFLNAV